MLSSRDEMRRVIHNSLEAIPAEPPTAAAVPIYLPNKDTSLSRRRQSRGEIQQLSKLHSRNSRVDYALIIINFTHSLPSQANDKQTDFPSGPHRFYDLCPALKYTHTLPEKDGGHSTSER